MSGDLKAVFGATKVDVAGGEEKTSWDQEEEEEGGGKDEQPTPLSSLLSADPSAEKEVSSGFQFSFFGDDTEPGSGETGGLYLRYLSQGEDLFSPIFKSLRFPLPAEYKVESIQAPKVSWQQDPRFHDSSSEEDEEEQEEEEEQSSVTAKTTEWENLRLNPVNCFVRVFKASVCFKQSRRYDKLFDHI